jgi:pyruvate kinase
VRKTKIVATIGPASRDPDTLVRMIEAGMDVARLNFSHGSRELHEENVDRLRSAAGRAGKQLAILQDLPGPKLRIGPLKDDLAELAAGDVVTLTGGHEETGDKHHMYVTWDGLAESLDQGDVIYLADGSIRMRVKESRAGESEVDATVEIGGAVASRQGLNVPGETVGLQAVPEADLEMLAFGEKIGVDAVALSFVRSPDDVTTVRKHTRLPLVAKIEKPQAVDQIEDITRAADVVMVARGDLGIEMPIEEVPIVQKRILACAGALARPSITATQMLTSMVTSSRPTRAEVADIANAIIDGTDAVMLSQETAVGEYPCEAIEMMAAIAETTERSLPTDNWTENRVRRDTRDPAYTIAHSLCVAASELQLAALVIPTLSGRSARLVSAHRPSVPIYALSPGRETVRRCQMMWGVQAASMPRREVTEQLITDAIARARDLGWVKAGERVGVTAGLPSGRPGTTSLIQIQDA